MTVLSCVDWYYAHAGVEDLVGLLLSTETGHARRLCAHGVSACLMQTRATLSPEFQAYRGTFLGRGPFPIRTPLDRVWLNVKQNLFEWTTASTPEAQSTLAYSLTNFSSVFGVQATGSAFRRAVSWEKAKQAAELDRAEHAVLDLDVIVVASVMNLRGMPPRANRLGVAAVLLGELRGQQAYMVPEEVAQVMTVAREVLERGFVWSFPEPFADLLEPHIRRIELYTPDLIRVPPDVQVDDRGHQWGWNSFALELVRPYMDHYIALRKTILKAAATM